MPTNVGHIDTWVILTHFGRVKVESCKDNKDYLNGHYHKMTKM